MKKWLHIIPYANFGGTEHDCLHVVSHLTNDLHQIWVYGRDGQMTQKWESKGAKVEHLNILRLNKFSFYFKLKNKCVGQLFDGVFVWSTIRLPLVINALKVLNTKVAIHVGNPVNLTAISRLSNYTLNILFPTHAEVCLFACSNYVLKSIANDPYYCRFESTVSINPVLIMKQNPHQCRKIGKESFVRLGVVARLDPIKDHLTVLRAFHKVSLRFPCSILEIVGEGPLLQKLIKESQVLGISEKIIFHGLKQNVYDFLNSWDLFLYATTKREGLGNAVSEALANGVPVVASDLPMIREIDGGSGAVLFCNPGDPDDMAEKIIGLLRDEQRRERMSEAGFHRASTAFNAERYVEDRIKYLLQG